MNTLTVLRTTHRTLGRVFPGFSARLARDVFLTPRRHPNKPWEQTLLAEAEPITFRFGFSALRWGGPGPRVLLQHGWEGRPTQFGALIPALVTEGYQVIGLEAPGHGRSPGLWPTVPDFAEALQEVVSELRGVYAVIGHSMGGGAALLALREGLSAQRAVTLAAPAAIRPVLDRYARYMGLKRPAHRRFLRQIEIQAGRSLEEVDIGRYARMLPQPGLIVHDRDDSSVPVGEAEILHRAWPGSRLLLTEGLGHRRLLGDARVVAAVRDFLAEGQPA